MAFVTELALVLTKVRLFFFALLLFPRDMTLRSKGFRLGFPVGVAEAVLVVTGSGAPSRVCAGLVSWRYVVGRGRYGSAVAGWLPPAEDDGGEEDCRRLVRLPLLLTRRKNPERLLPLKRLPSFIRDRLLLG